MDQETIRQYGDELYDAWLDRRVLSPLLNARPTSRWLTPTPCSCGFLNRCRPVKQLSARRLVLPASRFRTFLVFMSPILAS